MKNFRYKLRKGSKKEFCPNCRKKTFTPYISVINDEIANIDEQIQKLKNRKKLILNQK